MSSRTVDGIELYEQTPERKTDDGYFDYLRREVRKLYRAGETDALEGGVHPERLADEVAASASTLTDHLRECDGLVAVDGANPGSLRHRKCYAPVEAVRSEDYGHDTPGGDD